ncbi:hypothetical protein LP037_040 [Listeria phage LP-037]|uniref:Uncharacterized protein n=1 Tax=Listeria phage LP-037 TaxID=1173747 RepID=S4U6H3_9CAUD|nr:hypothetical protein LP037_040 [Listeria phage LP-037]AGI11655.1 hypothetical protein LP037_040 [Listeria phage LP-037]
MKAIMEKFSRARKRLIKENNKHTKQSRKERCKEGKKIAEKLVLELLTHGEESFSAIDRRGRELLSKQNARHMLLPTSRADIFEMFNPFTGNFHKHSQNYPNTVVVKMRRGIFKVKAWINHNTHHKVALKITFKSPIDGEVVTVGISVREDESACTFIHYGKNEYCGVTFSNDF